MDLKSGSIVATSFHIALSVISLASRVFVDFMAMLEDRQVRRIVLGDDVGECHFNFDHTFKHALNLTNGSHAISYYGVVAVRAQNDLMSLQIVATTSTPRRR